MKENMNYTIKSWEMWIFVDKRGQFNKIKFLRFNWKKNLINSFENDKLK